MGLMRRTATAPMPQTAEPSIPAEQDMSELGELTLRAVREDGKPKLQIWHGGVDVTLDVVECKHLRNEIDRFLEMVK